MSEYQILADLSILASQYGSLSAVELHCGPGVADALALYLPEREKPAVTDFMSLGVVGDIFAASVIEKADMPPGHWEILKNGEVADSGQLAIKISEAESNAGQG